MSEYRTFLITLLYGSELVRCALKVHDSLISHETVEFYLEEESKRALHALLPSHVASMGPIVQVELLFEATIVEKCS